MKNVNQLGSIPLHTTIKCLGRTPKSGGSPGSIVVYGELRATDHGIIFVSTSYWRWLPKTGFVSLCLSGIGEQGAIFTITQGSQIFIGECITHRLAGRTVIWCIHRTASHIYDCYGNVLPTATRNQARMIAFDKWTEMYIPISKGMECTGGSM